MSKPPLTTRVAQTATVAWHYLRFGTTPYFGHTFGDVSDVMTSQDGSDAQARSMGAVTFCRQTIANAVKPTNWDIVDNRNNSFEDSAPQSRVKIIKQLLEDPCTPMGKYPPDRFWDLMMFCLVAWGNAYALIEYGYYMGKRFPKSLRLAWPSNVSVRWSQGTLLYTLTFTDFGTGEKESVTVPHWEVIHLRNDDDDGYTSRAPLDATLLASRINRDALTTQRGMLNNKVRVGAMVKSPSSGWGNAKKSKDTANEWRDEMNKPENKGKIAWLPPGADAVFGNLSREDMEAIAAFRLTATEICGIYRVPPQICPQAVKEPGDRQTLKEVIPWFLTNTVYPHRERIEKELSYKLLGAEFYRIGWRVRMSTKALAMSVEEKQQMANLYPKGVATINEVRRSLGLPLIDGDEGDKLHQNPMGAGYGESTENEGAA